MAYNAVLRYAAILAERLREEVERKGLLPASQTGFRKGVGLVRRKERKMVIFFVDLKAAFDSVDREVLVKALRERGVREGLVVRCEEMLRETRSKVRVGGEEGATFWTIRGLRQGCPLSSLLFTLLLADMDEVLEKGRWGGVKLGERKVFTLAYADDVAMVAEDEEGMRGMMRGLERYLEERKLQLNAEKSKMMRCRRGGGRWKKITWRWKGKVLEEVSEFMYVGYVIMRVGGQRKHVEDRIRKGAAVMGQVWGIGKRRFGNDWGRRIWLFNMWVWSVISYGVEIWGWREWEVLERLQERFLRWVLGVERCTPGYMVRGRGRRGGEVDGWEKERRRFWEERGWSAEEAEVMMEEKIEVVSGEIVKRERRRQQEERWEKIRRAIYNEWYGRFKGEGIPGYMRKGWGES
ncbi:uncharacterized protein LOC143363245 [Halictus rubicundus]|uniref:uncharacterized protein LOC143363245 n=1 Tax=Halictus rubicundus TaxID=77578 RepID=UPI0040357BB8